MAEKIITHTDYDQLTPTRIHECIAFLEQALQKSRLPNLDTTTIMELRKDLEYLRNLMLQKIEQATQETEANAFANYNSNENWK